MCTKQARGWALGKNCWCRLAQTAAVRRASRATARAPRRRVCRARHGEKARKHCLSRASANAQDRAAIIRSAQQISVHPTFRTGSGGCHRGRHLDPAMAHRSVRPTARSSIHVRNASCALPRSRGTRPRKFTRTAPRTLGHTMRAPRHEILSLSLSLHASHSTRARPAKFWRATLADVTNGRRRSVHAATCRAQLSSLLVLLASVRAPPQREPPSPAHTLVYHP